MMDCNWGSNNGFSLDFLGDVKALPATDMYLSSGIADSPEKGKGARRAAVSLRAPGVCEPAQVRGMLKLRRAGIHMRFMILGALTAIQSFSAPVQEVMPACDGNLAVVVRVSEIKTGPKLK